MPYRRGQVVLVLFPESNLRRAKRRPALIVQADDLDSGLAQTIVAMISSNTTRAGHGARVLVAKGSTHGKTMGLLTNSVIMTDNLATIRLTEIDRAIGDCELMADVDAALATTLGLSNPRKAVAHTEPPE
jgi:mRNA interferase MazF